MEFGEKLKYLRESNNMQQKQLAKLLNVTPAAVCQYEKGKRIPNFIVYAKVLEVFEISNFNFSNIDAFIDINVSKCKNEMS